MKCAWIEPGVLAASTSPGGAHDLEALQAAGIRSVLSLTDQPLTRYRSVTTDLLQRLDLLLFHTPIRKKHPPTWNQARAILQIIDAMHEQQRPLLLHCHTGVGRTGTVLHLYYLAQGKTMGEASARIRAQRVQALLLSDDQKAFLHEFAARQPHRPRPPD